MEPMRIENLYKGVRLRPILRLVLSWSRRLTLHILPLVMHPEHLIFDANIYSEQLGNRFLIEFGVRLLTETRAKLVPKSDQKSTST